MNNELRQLYFGSGGIRGEIGNGLTPEIAMNYAAAFGTLNTGKKILIGRDSRKSSEMLLRAVRAGLTACGCEVIDGGVMCAGMVHFLVPELKFAGALLVSGGHLNGGRNGVMAFQPDGAYCDELLRHEIFEIYQSRDFRNVPADQLKKCGELPADAMTRYWHFLTGTVDVAAIKAAKLKVLADFRNGAGAHFAADFAALLGIELIAINDGQSAGNVRNFDVSRIAEEPLGKLITPLRANCAMVFNSDMSRLGLVSDGGVSLTEEMTYPLAADYFLQKRGRSGTLVVNCCSSGVIDEVAAKYKCQIVRCAVGQPAVIDAMRNTDAVMGGEGSGAFTFSRMNGFDAFLMAALILESIACSMPLSRRAAGFKKRAMVKMAIPVKTSHGYRLLRSIKGKIGGNVACSETDGLRFDWPNGFLSLRLSGTEPVMRVISESENPDQANEKAWQIRMLLENQADK